MGLLGKPLCNWQFEKCYLSHFPPIHCQFKDGCNKFSHTQCSILWSRTHGWNFHDLESVGQLCQEHYLDYDGDNLPNQTNNGTSCLWTWPPKEKYHEWIEPDMVEFVANGLWLTPDCKNCLLTNKYCHIGNKICAHTWQEQRLNKAGDHILFPLICWHKGSYEDDFKKTFIQAPQLFSAPSSKEGTARITHSFVGQDFIDGCLERLSIVELTHNIMRRWDESYPLSEFAPCSKFQDLEINP